MIREAIDVSLARMLVDSQFPQWSDLPIEAVELDGTPGSAGLIVALCTGKRHWRFPDVRRHQEG